MEAPYVPTAGLADEINTLRLRVSPLPWKDGAYVNRRIRAAKTAKRRIEGELERRRWRVIDGVAQSRNLSPCLRKLLQHRRFALTHIKSGFKRVEAVRSADWLAKPALHAPARPISIFERVFDLTDEPGIVLFP